MTKKPSKTTPKKPRAKQIELSHIEKQNKEMSKLSSFTLDEEQNLQIKYHEKFGKDKIDELLTELYEKTNYAKENNLTYFQEDDFFLQYTHFLIIKHFTSLENEIPDDLESQINIMEQIYNIGLFERLFDEVLPPDQVEKVIEKLEGFIINLANVLEAQEKELAKMEKLIKNKDVIHPLVNPMADSNG